MAEVRESTPAANSGGSTFGAPAPIERNDPQPVQELKVKTPSDANIVEDRHPIGERLNPAGGVTDRPDVKYREDVRSAEEAAALPALGPLPAGMIFSMQGGPGGGLLISADDQGAISVTIQPDKGLAVAVRVSGKDAESLRRALAGPPV